jgi:hypothetical protein
VPRSAHPSAPTSAAGAHAFCSQNHLQHFVWIFEEILEFVAGRSEYFLRQLRRHLDARHRRIFRDVANFIDLNARLSRQRGFQLFRKRRRLGVSAGEGAHKSRELRLRGRWRKMNASDSRGNQKLREAALARG